METFYKFHIELDDDNDDASGISEFHFELGYEFFGLMNVRYILERLLTGGIARLELINGSSLCCTQCYGVLRCVPAEAMHVHSCLGSSPRLGWDVRDREVPAVGNVAGFSTRCYSEGCLGGEQCGPGDAPWNGAFHLWRGLLVLGDISTLRRYSST
jgi:hypothetical protein